VLVVLFFYRGLLLYDKIDTLICFLAKRNHVIVHKLENFNLGAFRSVLEGEDVVVLVLVAQYAANAKRRFALITESLNPTFFVLVTEPQ